MTGKNARNISLLSRRSTLKSLLYIVTLKILLVTLRLCLFSHAQDKSQKEERKLHDQKCSLTHELKRKHEHSWDGRDSPDFSRLDLTNRLFSGSEIMWAVLTRIMQSPNLVMIVTQLNGGLRSLECSIWDIWDVDCGRVAGCRLFQVQELKQTFSSAFLVKSDLSKKRLHIKARNKKNGGDLRYAQIMTLGNASTHGKQWHKEL